MTAQVRNTKVVATLGPASDGLVEDLVEAGVDVFRLNFSHGSREEHTNRVRRIRKAADRTGRFVAILGDLQGPKIRIGGFLSGKTVKLAAGDAFFIDAQLGGQEGTQAGVGTTYAELANEVDANDSLVLGDGLIELSVKRVDGSRIHCEVRLGGALGANHGINKRGGGLSAPALTDKDVRDIAFACEQNLDYIAVSFPRSAEDMDRARALMAGHGVECGLVAKLERAEAVANQEVLDAIILASDAVMVARGDLGIEIGDARLMGVQKAIIARARALNRSVITATQMMESMIVNPRATRAEVMDVANAVLDGTDAVMLSGETAVGAYPRETVRAMVGIIRGAEATAYAAPALASATVRSCDAIDESVAIAAMTIADTLTGVRAVACLTASGNTPKLMSRYRRRLPIYALADNPRTLAKVALFASVHPVLFDTGVIDFDLINDAAIRWLQRAGVVTAGDRVILSKGDYRNVQGGTNTLKVIEVN